MKKPPYRVPSMRDISAIRGTNGFKVASTFSGCGGSCLGFEMAGFDVVWASEFNAAARNVYRINHPGTILDPRDIREVDPGEILEKVGCAPGEIDVFEGSPPCDSFSTVGPRQRLWGKSKIYSDSGKRQRTDDLFFEYLRILEGLRPKVFVAENVVGMILGVAKGYFKRVLSEMRALGYQTEAKVLDAQWLGVPQVRRRLIFMGSLNGKPIWPKPFPWRYSLREAFESPLASGVREMMSERMAKWWRHTRRGRSLMEGRRASGDSGYGSYMRKRLTWDRPCYTLVQDPIQLLHPDEPASLTIPEAKRVGSFPDDFQLVGKYRQQYARIGLSVPPVMSMRIAECVEQMLRREGKERKSSKAHKRAPSKGAQSKKRKE